MLHMRWSKDLEGHLTAVWQHPDTPERPTKPFRFAVTPIRVNPADRKPGSTLQRRAA